MPSGKAKVLVAMSGGVDSSVAAALLVRAGHDVVGCFMRLGSVGEGLDEIMPVEQAAPSCEAEEPHSGSRARVAPLKILHRGCCSISDAADARLVAAELGIPLYVCNFKRDFGRIVDYFVDEYAAGRTPNPCIRCNDWLKFGKLHDYAARLDCAFVASGHYARVGHDSGGATLRRAVDHAKDQSYVLFGVPRERLASMMLPIGDSLKADVRARARELGLPVFDKPDSQEICFVPDDDYAGLIERRRPDLIGAGSIVDPAGAAVGEHRGQHRFTIGQRRGVRVGGGERLYVIDRDAASNTVTIGPRDRLFSSGCVASEANWLTAPEPDDRWRPCTAKYRYNTPGAPAEYRRIADGQGPTPSGRRGRFEVRFSMPQSAVAPGQAVVLYGSDDTDLVLGGGWIERATRDS